MANDFSGDANLQALFNFDNGALTTDSSGNGNTLTNVNTVTADTGDFKQGDASADFEQATSELFSLANNSSSADFPFRAGDTTKIISLCCWHKIESFTTATPTIFSRFQSAGTVRTIRIGFDVNDKAQILIGYNNGNSEEAKTHGTACVTGRWYHFGFVFDDSDGSYLIRIWDDTAGAILGSDATGNFTNNIYVSGLTALPFYFGSYFGSAAHIDGLVDEMPILNRKISATEIDAIRAGTFGAAGEPSLGPFQHNPYSSPFEQGAFR